MNYKKRINSSSIF